MNGLPPLPEQVNRPMPTVFPQLPDLQPVIQPAPVLQPPIIQPNISQPPSLQPAPPPLPPVTFTQPAIQQLPQKPKSGFFNLVIIVIALIVLILIGYIVYTLITSNQNQSGFNPVIIPTHNQPASSPVLTSGPVNNQQPETVSSPSTFIAGTDLNWVRTQISSTKGIMWDVEIPSTWQKISINAEQGYIVTTGNFSDGTYNVVFSYPNLSVYSNGKPSSLDDWVNQDKQLIDPSDPQLLTSTPASISGADAVVVTGIPQSTGNNSSQTSNQGKYTIVYIWVHNGVGPQQIIITNTNGRYDQAQMDALTDRIIQGIKF